MMGDKLRMELESGHNPFKFEQYDKLDLIADATTPLVIMASPGMMQNGPSRELFMKWAPDKKNGIVFTGYCVEGSLAKKVMDSEKTIVVNDQLITREMSVEYISFSAHADFVHTQDYIKILQPPNIVLVHGDQNEMSKLKNALLSEFKDKISILTPKNCQQVRFKLVSKKSAKIIGMLAKTVMHETETLRNELIAHQKNRKMLPPSMPDVEMVDANQEEDFENFVTVDGVLIKQDFDRFILDESEVDKYTPLQCASMEQTLFVKYSFDVQVLTYFLYSYYADVHVEFPKPGQDDKFDMKFVVETAIHVSYYSKGEMLKVHWVTSPKNDLIADSLCLMVLQIKEKPTPQLL